MNYVIAAAILNDVRKNGKKSAFEEEKHKKACKRKCQLGRLPSLQHYKGSWLFRKCLKFGLNLKAARYYSICCKMTFRENVLQNRKCGTGKVPGNRWYTTVPGHLSAVCSHSHSSVAEGLGVRSNRTRLTPLTSAVMRCVICCSSSNGTFSTVALIASRVLTARSTTGHS